MTTPHDTLDSLGEWIKSPHDNLRKYPNGTLFILRTAQGLYHLCTLSGNMESDQSWKALRHSDARYIRLENLRQGATALILSNAKLSHEEGGKEQL